MSFALNLHAATIFIWLSPEIFLGTLPHTFNHVTLAYELSAIRYTEYRRLNRDIVRLSLLNEYFSHILVKSNTLPKPQAQIQS
jgi:hypothetical protein